MEYLTMNDNNKIPIIGFGTYFLNPYDTYEAVLNALKEGYTLLDCAKWYQNEALVGEAIKESKKKREELFITTKVECKRKEEAHRRILQSLTWYS